MKAAFIHSPTIERYHYPPDSPFKTQRAGMTGAILASIGLLEGKGRLEVPPEPAREEDLLLFHTPEYLEALRRASVSGMQPEFVVYGLGGDDCPVFPDLWDYTALAAGGTLTGARLILAGAVDLAFNPSGGYHHARRALAGGFCYLNDLALAGLALASAGLRVFCLDLDAHHGNGTQEAFWRDPRVFTVSLHENGKTLFPWGGFEDEIGEGPGRGCNVNLPLPAGTDDDLYRHAFRQIVPPLLAAFQPDVIILVLGMDVLAVDPLAHLKLTNNAFADLIPLLGECGKPLLVTGGGGYDPRATARGWALCWSVLCGIEPEASPSIGLGGVFLGNAEWGAGLRDPHLYHGGPESEERTARVARSLATIKKLVFPRHGIPLS